VLVSSGAGAQGAWHQYARSSQHAYDARDFVQAKSECLKALRELQADDPRYCLSLQQLSRIYTAQKNTEKAIQVLSRAMDLCRERRPVDLNLYAELLRQQSQTYKAANRPDLARIADEQLTFIAAKPQPKVPSEPEWKQLRTSLSTCYREQRFADAEPLLKRYLVLMENECGKDSPLLAPVMLQYSRVLQRLGKSGESDRYAELAANLNSSKPVEATRDPDPTEEDALAELDKQAQAIFKHQRETEKRELDARLKEEERIARAQEKERQAQTEAMLASSKDEAPRGVENVAATPATTRAHGTHPETIALQQRALAEAHASMNITPGSIPAGFAPVLGTVVPGTVVTAPTSPVVQSTSFTSPAVFSSPASGVSIGGLGFSASVGNASK
jgi:hypothetical protein